jgi:integration host factor subunit alpha
MDLSFDSLGSLTLTKAQMSEMLFEQIGLNKREANELIDAFFDTVAAQLVLGNDVKLSGFGSFEVRAKSARPGRNPKTGAPVPIAQGVWLPSRPVPHLKTNYKRLSISNSFWLFLCRVLDTTSPPSGPMQWLAEQDHFGRP